MNRIDSRARGNAPQLLEKYRKLAHDAHLNGDRVTEEYYLQFADHYFRVIADQKQRQEESRQPRRDDRSQDYGDDYGADDDFYGDNSGMDRVSRPERETRPEREPRVERETRVEAPVESSEPADGNVEAAEGERPVYEPVENPFVRGNRVVRGLKQRKPRRGSQDEDGDDASQPEAPNSDFDPAILPPSISAKPAEKTADAGAAADKEQVAEEKPRRRRARKASPPADEAGAAPEAVNG